MAGRNHLDAGPYPMFAAELRHYEPDRANRVHLPTGRLSRRVAFWAAAAVPLLALALLGRYLAGAAPAAARSLLHSGFAPLLVFPLRVVGWSYFLPLAAHGISPSPLFAVLAVYLVAGFALLGRRRWRQAVIVLLFPLLCGIPLALVGLHSAGGQTASVKEAFSAAVMEDGARSSFAVTGIDYRFVVFDGSGSRATVAVVVSLAGHTSVFKSDEAAELVRASSGRWQVESLRQDFHPGYEP